MMTMMNIKELERGDKRVKDKRIEVWNGLTWIDQDDFEKEECPPMSKSRLKRLAIQRGK